MKYLLIGLCLFARAALAQIPPDGVIGPGQTVVIDSEVHRTGPIFVSGGRLEVTGSKLFLNGSLWITQGGSVVFDAAEFHQEGEDTHVIVGAVDPRNGDGFLTFRNGSRLHFNQWYVSQHEIQGRNASRIVLDRSRIDCDAATGVVRLFDAASYTATQVTAAADAAQGFPGCWMTTYMNGQPLLSLDSVNTVGDIMFYDAARIEVRRSVGAMPWLYFPAGAVADLSFPDSACSPSACAPVTKTIDSTTVQGIQWSVVVDQSYGVAWGINSNRGSSVIVRDSDLSMALVRLGGAGTYVIPGDFRNDTQYVDRTFTSLDDRLLRLVNTHVKWWKVDTVDYAQARIDSIVFSEMMVKNHGRALVTRSTCEGQTIHLGAIDNGYVYFKDGLVETFVSVWDDALMVLDNTSVDYTKAPVPHQTRNIAHNRARLYALNSDFVAAPEAMEYALVTFARLGSFADKELNARAKTPTAITGSAWIVTGPQSGVSLARWVLAIRPQGGAWTNFASGTGPVRDAALGTLPAALIPAPGNYDLRLSLLVSGDDNATQPTWAFPAVKTLVVQ